MGVREAALAGLAGIDLGEFCEEEDPVMRLFHLAVSRKSEEIRAKERAHLARKIRNEVMEGISG